MRCPHCRGQIPGGSRFCGVCGADVTAAPTRASGPRPSAAGEGASASLFELPVSRGARLARVFVVLALDLLLAGAGVAMILAYLDARKATAGEVAAPPDAGARVEVAALPPRPLGAQAEPAARSPQADGLGEAASAGDLGGAEPGGRAPGKARPAAAREPATADARRERRRRESAGDPPRRPASAEPGAAETEPAAPGAAEAEAEEPEAEATAESGELADPYPEAEPGASAPGGDAGVDSATEVERLAARISLLVDRHQGQLQRCYERAAKLTTPSEPLEGRVEVRFRVTPEGRAEDVQVMANDTGSRPLGDCLSGLVASWSFPAGAREPTDFLWPFVFRAPQ